MISGTRGNSPDLSSECIAIVGQDRETEAILRFCESRGQRVTEVLDQADRIVVSSRVSRDSELLESPRRRGVPIVSAPSFSLARHREVHEAPLVVVTGTSGRAASASLLEGMLRSAGRMVFRGGGFSAPLVSPLADDGKEFAPDVVVAELTCEELSLLVGAQPKVAVFTRLAGECDPMLDACGLGSVAVLNLDDAFCARFSEKSPCDVRWFSSRPPESVAQALVEDFSGAYRDSHGQRLGLTANGVSESVRVGRLMATLGLPWHSLLSAACAASLLGARAQDLERYLRALEERRLGWETPADADPSDEVPLISSVL